MTRRLPFFPEPEPLELVSNWLLRLAGDYRFGDVDSFLRCTVPPEVYAVFQRFRRQMNSFLPPVFLNHLADLTGLPVDRFSQMTLAHWVPCLAVFSHASGQVLRDYIRGFRVLRGVPQPHFNPKPAVVSPYFPLYPWGNLGVYNEPLVCQRCVELAGKHEAYLDWSFGLVASCPWHGIFLAHRGGGRFPPEIPVRLSVDWFSSMALRQNRLLLPSGAVVTGAWWFRFLRALIEDLYHPEPHLHYGFMPSGIYGAIWQQLGEPMPRIHSHGCFELDGLEERSRYLRAASLGVDLLMHGELRPPTRSQALLKRC